MPKSWASRTPPPASRKSNITPYPDTRPVPTLHRVSGLRSGTQGSGAATPQPSSPRHSPSPPPTPPHPNPVIPAPEPEPRGRARKPPLPSSPTNTPSPQSRHSTPQAGTQGTGPETTTTIIPYQHPLTPIPSFRPPSRNPGDGRGNRHNRRPPPTPPYRRAGVGRYPGDGRGYPLNPPHQRSVPSPGEHRRAGVGRYPGDGRGYPPTLHINVHVPSPGEHRRAGVTLYPDTGPQPRGSGRTTRIRHKPRPPGPGHKRVQGRLLVAARRGAGRGTARNPRHPEPASTVIPDPHSCHPERSRRTYPLRPQHTPFIPNSPPILFPLTTANARP